MKKKENTPHKFKSLSDVHRVLGLPKPLHPLISLVNNNQNKVEVNKLTKSHIQTFYKISYKANLRGN